MDSHFKIVGNIVVGGMNDCLIQIHKQHKLPVHQQSVGVGPT